MTREKSYREPNRPLSLGEELRLRAERAASLRQEREKSRRLVTEVPLTEEEVIETCLNMADADLWGWNFDRPIPDDVKERLRNKGLRVETTPNGLTRVKWLGC